MPRKHIMPAILSGVVWPGLGQIVKGEILKGLLICLVFPFALFMTVVFSVLFSLQLGIALYAILGGLYLWNVYDAYQLFPK